MSFREEAGQEQFGMDYMPDYGSLQLELITLSNGQD